MSPGTRQPARSSITNASITLCSSATAGPLHGGQGDSCHRLPQLHLPTAWGPPMFGVASCSVLARGRTTAWRTPQEVRTRVCLWRNTAPAVGGRQNERRQNRRNQDGTQSSLCDTPRGRLSSPNSTLAARPSGPRPTWIDSAVVWNCLRW